jgi:hypothetical protein
MHTGTGTIIEIQRDQSGITSARIDCQPGLIPAPGQFLRAHNPDEADAVLGWSLFPWGADPTPNLVAGPIPPAWIPGSSLNLYGPIGTGFEIPSIITRLALIALGDSASRLLPLIPPALENNSDIAIFSLVPLPSLSMAIEIHPISEVPEALSWANFIAIDLGWQQLPTLREKLTLGSHDYLPCPAQALITIPMPCAGIGDCGACAIKSHRGYKLACKDGPVFDLNTLEW